MKKYHNIFGIILWDSDHRIWMTIPLPIFKYEKKMYDIADAHMFSGWTYLLLGININFTPESVAGVEWASKNHKVLIARILFNKYRRTA